MRRVLQVIALYPDRAELKREYPEVEDDDISQALDFAARNLDDQILPLEAVWSGCCSTGDADYGAKLAKGN